MDSTALLLSFSHSQLVRSHIMWWLYVVHRMNRSLKASSPLYAEDNERAKL
jgi:hypothetical protein